MKNSESLAERAALKFWEESFDRARRLADEALEMNSRSAKAFLYRGLARRKLGEDEGALKDLTEAIRLDPGNWLAWSSRAKIWKSRGHMDRYRSDQQKVDQLKARHPVEDSGK